MRDDQREPRRDGRKLPRYCIDCETRLNKGNRAKAIKCICAPCYRKRYARHRANWRKRHREKVLQAQRDYRLKKKRELFETVLGKAG